MRQDVGEPEEAGHNIPDELNEDPVQSAGDQTPTESQDPLSPQVIHLSEGRNAETVTTHALTPHASPDLERLLSAEVDGVPDEEEAVQAFLSLDKDLDSISNMLDVMDRRSDDLKGRLLSLLTDIRAGNSDDAD